MSKNSAVLFNVAKCIGCGSCTVACKLWNDLEFSEGNAHGFDAELSADNWTVVQYHTFKNAEGQNEFRFAKRQCMHCLEPACASVCFANAITVDENGAVVYNPKKCVGCRYCLIACPYDVPKYEWNKVFPSVMKCQLCSDKLAEGGIPSCVSVCPTGALIFGDRDELLDKAHAIISSSSATEHSSAVKYVNEVYGETQGGGTRWLYISDVPFADLGFPTSVPTRSIPDIVQDYTKWKPGVFLGAAAAFSAIGLYTKRRLKIEAEKMSENGGEDNV